MTAQSGPIARWWLRVKVNHAHIVALRDHCPDTGNRHAFALDHSIPHRAGSPFPGYSTPFGDIAVCDCGTRTYINEPSR